MILKLSMKHRVLKQCPIGSPIRLNGENNDFFFNEGNVAANDYIIRIFTE